MELTTFFRIKDRIQETHDTFVFVLEPLQATPFQYQAGQFLTFIFRHSLGEFRRSYSLCTTPGLDLYPAIVVKRITNGEASRHMHDHWKIGDVVESLTSAGRFTLKTGTDPRDIFLLAAGSGISPLFGLLKQVLYQETQSHVHLFYSNKNVENAIFYKELHELQEKFPDRLHVEYFFSESKYLERARLNRVLLEKLVLQQLRFDIREALFFTCGPYIYMQMAEIVLVTMGIEKQHIRKETFIIPKPAAPRFELEDKSSKEVQLSFQGKTYQILVPYPRTILDVALEYGIPLPYSCRAGRCSACTAKCVQGKVLMSYNEVLTEKDEQRGYVLTCTGHPASQGVALEF
jgi:ring-1,2-phenylacetyl-CoA epoxidase subunit PaaE